MAKYRLGKESPNNVNCDICGEESPVSYVTVPSEEHIIKHKEGDILSFSSCHQYPGYKDLN